MSLHIFPRLWAPALFVAFLSVTGCGIGTTATNSSGALRLQGSIYGGQQPVSGSSIKLYSAGKSGNGSAAMSMLRTPVTSDAGGNFTITGDYTCANADDQVYLVATGGNPGLAPGTNNHALVLMNALGRCADLPSTPYVSLNEMTTVAAAWALAPFMTSATNIGTSATNSVGITNGFLNAALLVDPHSGGLTVLPSNLHVETGKITALANSVAGCVNSDGGTGCSPLFTAATPAGVSAPTDTLTAALNIVKHPSENVEAVFYAASPFAPFSSTMTDAPNDWTMSMTVTGGGLNQPTALGVDAGGSVWVAGYQGVLSGFTPQGKPMKATGFGVGALSENYGLTIDTSGNIWVANEETPSHGITSGSVSKFAGSNTANPGALLGTYSDASMDYPVALAADTNGNILIANSANASGSIYDTNGNVVSSYLGSGNSSFPAGVAADSTHGMWLANQSDNTVTHIAADGTVLARPDCCSGALAIATDSLGNAWVANYFGTSVSEVSAAGTTTLSNIQTGGIQHPSAIVIDGAQDVWLTNYRGKSLSHLAGNGGSVTAGTALSPSTGLGKDASLLLPFGAAIDPTGNVWISNMGNNDLVMFFGLAAPTKTPVAPIPTLP